MNTHNIEIARKWVWLGMKQGLWGGTRFIKLGLSAGDD